MALSSQAARRGHSRLELTRSRRHVAATGAPEKRTAAESRDLSAAVHLPISGVTRLPVTLRTSPRRSLTASHPAVPVPRIHRSRAGCTTETRRTRRSTRRTTPTSIGCCRFPCRLRVLHIFPWCNQHRLRGMLTRDAAVPYCSREALAVTSASTDPAASAARDWSCCTSGSRLAASSLSDCTLPFLASSSNSRATSSCRLTISAM